MQLTLSPVKPEHSSFLFELFAEIKTDELNLDAWPKEQRDRMLASQYWARETSLQSGYVHLDDSLILMRGLRIGRVIVDRPPDHLVLVDLEILKEHRGQGAGRLILNQLIAEARDTNRAVFLNVAVDNRHAIAFYEKSGFQKIELNGFHFKMQLRS